LGGAFAPKLNLWEKNFGGKVVTFSTARNSGPKMEGTLSPREVF